MPGPLTLALTTGTMSAEGAQVDGPEAVSMNSQHGHHNHHHAAKKKTGLFTSCSQLLGLDTFLTIAFQGYKGSQTPHERARQRKPNPWTRGVLRNCQDFWLDGPVFVRKEQGTMAMLGGEVVDYAVVYDVPRRGQGAMGYRRGGYDGVAQEEGEGGGEV
ncbi:hypothetical protein LTR62_003019 [Meristemomyces frigidus]|uniref:Uncharacterized protein n=1 Tax=Meristemomyces frigidus TaxID=1508187 RepID=A0AAN7YJX3_9PEZI|nr:hypothetical protein LTR62_003019 [Meristemomyces frigidus]